MLVRNRSKELAELLSDSDRIRMERRKARANKQKYKGFEGGSGIGSSGFSSGSMSTGGRYGGFGSESGKLALCLASCRATQLTGYISIRWLWR